MFDDDIYFNLLDWLETATSAKWTDFLKRLQTSYNLSGCLYMDASITSAGAQVYRYGHTFDQQAKDPILMLDAPVLRNVLSQLSRAMEPVDMHDLAQLSEEGLLLRSKLRDLPLPRQAVSYPLLSVDGRGAILAIASNACEEEWRRFRRCHDRDVHLLAGKFHAGLIKRCDGARIEALPTLTRREQETLRWTAAGKSYWETAVILGISERTVRYFMANARIKLDAVSNTQAVAKALQRGLIPPEAPL
ncbi:LuxR C-terminal-related transcriptional regulator [Agrobacterium vitis]|uniref:helix-turn-helix transcriptional regulator n=1 Tax=Agrobacterium vitis TaxID=373 RepID=UPI0012E78E93|nr:LuxR C-terminal-related transcriptional regulator [Agrobacterium vitis]MVA26489.1 LuxR family transcriptional regulator [Agrobacterium vitis]